MRKRSNFFISISCIFIVAVICIFGHINMSANHDKQKELVANVNSENDTGTNIYRKNTEKFVTVSANEILNDDSKDSFLLYIGRETCPYCQKFVKELSKVSEKFGKTIYYLDSENVSEDKELQEVGKKFNIKAVPTLLNITTKNKESSKYSGETFEDLEQWIKSTDD